MEETDVIMEIGGITEAGPALARLPLPSKNIFIEPTGLALVRTRRAKEETNAARDQLVDLDRDPSLLTLGLDQRTETIRSELKDQDPN